MVGPDYEKWVPTVLQYTCTIISVMLAFVMQRLFSAIHSGVRGGLMCTRAGIRYLSKRKVINLDHENTCLDEVTGYVLAVMGFCFQVSTGFSLRFPFNLVLFPVTIMEYSLQVLIAVI